MFGCFSYDTRVTLADGTQEKIGKIVNQKLPVEVLSYDVARDEFVPRKVVELVRQRTDRRVPEVHGGAWERQRSVAVRVTANHLISTPYGWVHAGDLEVGDTVLQAVQHRLSPFQWDVLLGGLMGDGALSPSRSGHGAGSASGTAGSRPRTPTGRRRCSRTSRSRARPTTRGGVPRRPAPARSSRSCAKRSTSAGKKVLSWDYLKRLTPLSIAIWYQDDGSFQLRSKGSRSGPRGAAVAARSASRRSSARLASAAA
jgi:recombination protein RecA